MGLFSFMKSKSYIDSIEWKEPVAHSIVHRLSVDRNPIRMGAQLIVRESQCAVIVSDGRIADVFGPGRYTLSMETLPVLTVMNAWKHDYQSPFEADVYFINTKQYPDQKWSTVAPIVVQDADYGTFKLRASGVWSWKVSDTERFMKDIFSGNQIYDTAFIIGQLKSFFVTGLSDMLAETAIPADQLTGKIEELSERTENHLQNRFARMGLELSSFIIEEMIVQDEIVKEIEERARRKAQEEEEARLKALEEEEARLKALEEEARLKAHEEEEAAPAVAETTVCGSCGTALEPNMKFCPECGAKI